MDMKGLYAKDIFRSIDGVIKADDVSKVASEVDEYVMTKEIRDGLWTSWVPGTRSTLRRTVCGFQVSLDRVSRTC